jgi:hypothetical protein
MGSDVLLQLLEKAVFSINRHEHIKSLMALMDPKNQLSMPCIHLLKVEIM